MNPAEFVESLVPTGMFKESQELRAKALSWWRLLSFDEQKEIVAEHEPDRPFGFVASSSSRIEQIFIKEHE